MADEKAGTAYTGESGAEMDDATREMIEAGVFFGKKKSKTHPKMRQYILANRGGIEIINLAKTTEGLAEAAAFVREKAAAGGLPFLVGTQPAAAETVAALAKEFHAPYVIGRWVGGTLTNFKTIFQRIEYLKKLRSGLASGAYDKYTKKERLGIEREVARLTELMGGLEDLSRLPDVLLVIDPKLHQIAVREARHTGVPVVALADTDTDPDLIAHLVPGNTKSVKSIGWFLGKVRAVLEEAKRMPKAAPAPEKAGAAPSGV